MPNIQGLHKYLTKPYGVKFLIITILAVTFFEVYTGYFSLLMNNNDTNGLINLNEVSQQRRVEKSVRLLEIGDKKGFDYVNAKMLLWDHNTRIALIKELNLRKMKISFSDDVVRTCFSYGTNYSSVNDELKAYAGDLVQIFGVDAAYKFMGERLKNIPVSNNSFPMLSSDSISYLDYVDRAIKQMDPISAHFDANRQSKVKTLQISINEGQNIRLNKYNALNNQKINFEIDKNKAESQRASVPDGLPYAPTVLDYLAQSSKDRAQLDKLREANRNSTAAEGNVKYMEGKIYNLEEREWKPLMSDIQRQLNIVAHVVKTFV